MKNFKIAFVSSLMTILILATIFSYFYFNNKILLANNNIESVSEKLDEPNDSEQVDLKQIDDNTNTLYQERNNIITRTVKKVSAAVVGINVTEIRKYRSPWGQDPFFRYFFGDRVFQREVKSLGSGAIISPDGYIITNDHVAGNASKVIVTMTDGNHYNAKIIGSDQISDICLLKIDTDKDLPYIELGDSDDLMIGEWVIALGNPFGLFEINDKPTVTVGVISNTNMNLGRSRDRFYLDMIQTDASINSGNSGGPLVNSIGQIIGMNTLIYSETGGSVGVGFAIPVNKIKKIIAEIKENGYVDRNFWTGLSVQTIDEGIARYYGLQNVQGVIITHVQSNSPGEKAGIEVGDIITHVNNFRIEDDNMLIGVLQEFRTGDKLKLRVIRNNEEIIKYMRLEARND
ncbi:MAG: PDZ domain-containing protein [Ignavibacteria bacterium]|nr:MAG: PDZ domain-containing protein [Ignavibacteria bacterium]